MKEEEFWRLTPRQFSVLLDRAREQAEHEEWLAGTVAAQVVNYSGFGKPKQWRQPADFFPNLPRWKQRPGDETRPERMTKRKREHVAQSIRAMRPFQLAIEKAQQQQ